MFASDVVVGDVEPGQLPRTGKQTFGWGDIAWIHVGNRVTENESHPQDGGGRAEYPPGAPDTTRTAANQYTAFGIPIADLTTPTDVLDRILSDVHQTGGWHRSPDGRLTSCAWVDPSGARLDLLLSQDCHIVCATPQLEGCQGSQVVRVREIVDETTDTCPGCAVVDADLLLAGGRACPITFAPAGIAPDRDCFGAAAAQRATVQVALVLVAEAIVLPNRVDGSDHTSRSRLVHLGQFPGNRSRATVRATCRVAHVDCRETSFRQWFWCLQVECLGHCFDLVADPIILPRVDKGDLLNVSAWVCGQAWW